MIKFEVKFDERAFKNEFEKVALNAMKDEITSKVGQMKCPEHGKAPAIAIKGKNLEKLTVTVEGCCQGFVDSVEKHL